MRKLAAIIKNIKSRTGLDVNVYSEDKRYLVTESAKPVILPDNYDFTDIYRSEKLKRTFFKFRYLENGYVGSIDGIDKTSENYAYLIVSLIENYRDETEGVSDKEIVKRIVLGEMSLRAIELFRENKKIDNNECFCLAISCEKQKTGDVFDYLTANNRSQYNLITEIDSQTVVYVKINIDAEEKVSPKNFAIELHDELLKSAGIKTLIGVGCYKENLAKISISFKEAIASLKSNGFLHRDSEVRFYRDFTVARLLNELPKNKLDEVISTLLSEEGKRIFDDEEMVLTARVLMENDLNISEASRALFMHRNTLTYRLDKIEKATNLDIRKFSDAVIFSVLSILKRITD